MQFPKNLSAQPKLVTGYHAMVGHILEVGIGIKRYWPMLWNSVFLLGPFLFDWHALRMIFLLTRY